jgi:hypothetical protein
MQEVRCPSCQTLNTEEAKYCMNCGVLLFDAIDEAKPLKDQEKPKSRRRGCVVSFFIAIVLLIAFICIVANLPTQPTQSQPKPFKVTLNTTPIVKSGEIGFHIITNLPDGMMLNVDLFNDNTDYHSQDQVIIKNGATDTTYFSNDNNPLEKGRYDLQVTSPFSIVQNESVQAVIGKHGEYMKGNLIINNSAINFSGLYTVKYDKEFNI